MSASDSTSDSFRSDPSLSRRGSFHNALPDDDFDPASFDALTPNPLPQNVPQCPNSADMVGGYPDPVTPIQRRALDLLLLGKKVSHVAKKVGIDRRTLYRWRREDVDFMIELRRGRRLLRDQTADQLTALLPMAVKVIRNELACCIQDASSVRTALALIKLTNVDLTGRGRHDDD